ncbi:putative intestinal mucin-like protein-like [Triplophysa rosa]|uniref:Intestinal mucin-like protein-like n=2 Tax=Triplophysa rosa TaxID=992332 RepID=A0A9W8CC95_TRIRA|nr:putative intestinal mucin-like protein-like [Triplophysa rosa]
MGVCCPISGCLPKPVCVFNNTEYMPGSVVPANPCENCVCGDNVDPKTQLHAIECQPVKCDPYCPLGYSYQPVAGQCCGKCVQTSCVAVYQSNITYTINPGDMWSPPGDNCTKFECVKVGKQFMTIEAKIMCPSFNPTECVPGTQVVAPDGCCLICEVMPKHCNVSRRSTYLESNGCKTLTPVEMGTCDGSCGTYSMYSTKYNAVQHSCSCCREMATSEREAELLCPNGSKVIHTYVFIETCGCVETDCVDQQLSAKKQRHKRSQR